MKLLVLLSVLGLAVGCGTDASYTRTLASEEETEQTKKGNRALKIAGITAGVALAGCVIVGVVKKKCITFAKKVAQNVEDVRTTKSVDPSKKVASESAGVSGAKPKQGDEPDLDNVQKEAKDSEVKEQEVQTTAESSSSNAKPKQDDEPDLSDTKKTVRDSEGNEIDLEELKEELKRKGRVLIKIPRDPAHVKTATGLAAAMKKAGIRPSNENFEKLLKNIENGSVFFPSKGQIGSVVTIGNELTKELATKILNAHGKVHLEFYLSYVGQSTDRISKLGMLEFESPHDPDYGIAIQQLVDEGVYTAEIGKKLKAYWNDEWVPVTEMFK